MWWARQRVVQSSLPLLLRECGISVCAMRVRESAMQMCIVCVRVCRAPGCIYINATIRRSFRSSTGAVTQYTLYTALAHTLSLATVTHKRTHCQRRRKIQQKIKQSKSKKRIKLT